ncbi:MAG: serine hydrolase [Nitrospirales bacterium]
MQKHALGSKTIRDLLCHQSGLPAWRSYYLDFSPESPRDLHEYRQREAAVLQKILHEPLEEARPQKSVYSDLGFMVLGFLVERVTGKTLAEFCGSRIFEPLHARPLCFNPRNWQLAEAEREKIAPTEQDPWRGRLLQGEVHDDNAFALGGMAGHAGLFGTIEAAGQVTKAWLEGYHGKPGIFDAQLVKQFVTAQPKTSWALGWDTPSKPSSSGKGFSPESFGHLGFTGTSIWIDPIRELEVIFLSNRVHPTRDNPAIKEFRPKLHDLVIQELG